MKITITRRAEAVAESGEYLGLMVWANAESKDSASCSQFFLELPKDASDADCAAEIARRYAAA